MRRLIDFFTHRDLRQRLSKLESEVRELRLSLKWSGIEERILALLDRPKITRELASGMRKSRCWRSYI